MRLAEMTELAEDAMGIVRSMAQDIKEIRRLLTVQVGDAHPDWRLVDNRLRSGVAALDQRSLDDLQAHQSRAVRANGLSRDWVPNQPWEDCEGGGR
jgi:hypothetical protein